MKLNNSFSNTSKILFALFLGLGIFVSAHDAVAGGDTTEEFNAGDVIIHHVQDAHEIHFLTTKDEHGKEHHLSIPLPVIVYSEQYGFEVFSSSHFHHSENHIYKNYKMEEGHIYLVDDQGNDIMATAEDGTQSQVAPLDLSMTKTVVGIWICVILMFVIFGSVARAYKKRPNQAPKGLQSWIEPLIIFIRDEVAKPSIGPKYERYMPFLLSIFFFIWIGNLLGLIPFIGGFNVTGNIAVCLVLATFTFLITQFSGNKHYWQHIFWTPGVPVWLKIPPLMPLIEVMGVFIKPIVLTLRLFANITAGHIIILSFVSLIFIFNNLYGAGGGYGISVLSVAFSIFMNVIELLVAFLQAYVFTLLTALYFGSAVEEHHHEEAH